MSYVQQIGQSIEGIEANYEKYDGSAFNNGGVAEHTAMGHKKSLKEVIDLFKVIAVSSDLFGSEFSMNEMNQIVGLAEKLAGSPYNENALNEDGYKPLISRMKVIFGEKRAWQYKTEVDKLQGLIVRVEDMLKEEKRVSSMKEVIDGIKDQLNDITKSQEHAHAGLKDVQDKSTKAEGVLNSVNTTSEDIKTKHSIIVAFFEEIMNNQGKLKKLQEDNTKFMQGMEENDAEYKKKREDNLQKSQEENTKFVQEMKENEEKYEEKREEHLQKLEAEKTDFLQKTKESEEEHKKNIDEVLTIARGMLDSANVAGLAGAFNQRIIKGEKGWGRLWLAGAFIFIMGGIVITLFTNGVNILGLSISGTAFDNIWARIPITTLPLLAAYFCAAQYLKLERTLEDYEYKKALAQSMPVFMEQLGKGDEDYRHAYLSLALQQMLQDPLRKKHDVPSPFKDLFEMIKKPSKDT